MSVRKIDCRYEACPIPLLKTMKEIKKIKSREIIIIESDHTCSIVNIQEWAENEGHSFDYLEISPGMWEVYVQKK